MSDSNNDNYEIDPDVVAQHALDTGGMVITIAPGDPIPMVPEPGFHVVEIDHSRKPGGRSVVKRKVFRKEFCNGKG